MLPIGKSCDGALITALMSRGGNAYVRTHDPFVDVDAIGIRSNYDASVSRQSVAAGVATNLTAAASTALVAAGVYKQSAAVAASNLASTQYTLLTSSSNLTSLSQAYASALDGGDAAAQQAAMANTQTALANQFVVAAQASNAVAAATLRDRQTAAAQTAAAVKTSQTTVANATVAANATNARAAADAQNASNATNAFNNTPQTIRVAFYAWMITGYYYETNPKYYTAMNAANTATATARASAQAAQAANAALVAANVDLQTALAAATPAANALAAAQAAADDAARNLAAAQSKYVVAQSYSATKNAVASTAAMRTVNVKSALDATTKISSDALTAAPLAMASASNAASAYLQKQQAAALASSIAGVARAGSGNLDVISLGGLLQM